MQVSATRYDRPEGEIKSLIDSLEQRRDTVAREAARKIEMEFTVQEVEREVALMKDGASGIDGVRLIGINAADNTTKREIFKSVIQLLETDPNTWPEETKEGWVVPIHKKGPKNDLQNYRGICLLPLASRIIARVLASRIRLWAEEIGALDENQNGFRKNRSTADATQTIIRIDEETSRVLGRSNRPDPRRPGAVLLDIKKAYPRTNKPLLWGILGKLGMPPSILEILKGLHENTQYRVKGKQELSTPWTPQRGLREGCATSPILFNIYHATSMRQAQMDRIKEAKEECGLKWTWRPGNSLPPATSQRNLRNSNRIEFQILDSLFADDSTLVGSMEELSRGKETIKKTMLKYEEVCHDGKEEFKMFGSEAADRTRMLGTLIGRKEDINARIKRGYHAWSKAKKWLWKSTLSKRTKAVIVQAVVESTMLFDCSVRPWTTTHISKLQRVADIAYRNVWNNGKGLALYRMQKEGVNSFEIRRQLGITSIRQKMETRALERIGHVTRMPDTRTVKKITLGNWTEVGERLKNGKNNTITYWKRILKEAGLDWTNIEGLTMDRKNWKGIVNERKKAMDEWENKMCEIHKGDLKPTRSQAGKPVTEEGFKCRWPPCEKTCRTKVGRDHHETRIHKRNELIFECGKCHTTIEQKAQRTNHAKQCGGAPRGTCPDCGKELSTTNMARHRRTYCLRRHDTMTLRSASTLARTTCPDCGIPITKTNVARHRNTACPGSGSRDPQGL